MPEDRIEPLSISDLDALDHADALRVVRRLARRFPCMAHERWNCSDPFGRTWRSELDDAS